MLKVNHTTSKTSPKLFIGGKPKDFTITSANGASTSAVMHSGGKHYAIRATGQNYDASALREVAEHFAELADILEGKLSTAA